MTTSGESRNSTAVSIIIAVIVIVAAVLVCVYFSNNPFGSAVTATPSGDVIVTVTSDDGVATATEPIEATQGEVATDRPTDAPTPETTE